MARVDLDNNVTQLENALDIRYVKLHFFLRMIEDTVLPRSKTSMLRGGMGQVLLDINCVCPQKGDCDHCGFESECIIHRIMYSKSEIHPEHMSDIENEGYVIECDDHREMFREGDILRFNLLLFGKEIVYFSQFLNAFIMLGTRGLGKYRGRYQVQSITNTMNEDLLDEDGVDMSRYKVLTVRDYVSYRIRKLSRSIQQGRANHLVLDFRTPLALKSQGEYLKKFDIYNLAIAVTRRIYALDCYEGIETKQLDVREYPMPEVIREYHKPVSMDRYSERQKTKMTFRGIEGRLVTDIPGELLIHLLLAGELIHVGKKSSFGFGRYNLSVQ